MASLLASVKSSAVDFFESSVAPHTPPVLARLPKAFDKVIRFYIRQSLGERLREIKAGSMEEQHDRFMKFVAQLKTMPIAIQTEAANEQHYEVPAEFYQLCLGKWLKYSSCMYDENTQTLDQAEENMLKSVCRTARIDKDTWAEAKDDAGERRLRVLDLGCGWGSFALYVASNYSYCDVTAVSNSHSQRKFIEGEAAKRGLKNLKVITRNVVELDFEANVKFDRVCSTEMFEHMKNYERLIGKISTWLNPGGLLFVHIFVHKDAPYHFEDGWMAKTFFSGGTMPSDNLLLYFQKDLSLIDHRRINGVNYAKTCDHWLERMDANLPRIRELFAQTYGADQVDKQVVNWRLFYLACSELFAYNQGEEWFVSHYVFQK